VIGSYRPRRDGYKISSWYATDDGEHAHYERQIEIDATAWHTYRTEWTPESLTFYVDGDQIWTLREHVPQGSMHLALQTAQEEADEDRPRSEGGQDIRAVRLYGYEPGRADQTPTG
jgi:beta-glucanase (GH16 family)